jgi:hypothetical protein
MLFCVSVNNNAKTCAYLSIGNSANVDMERADSDELSSNHMVSMDGELI